MSNRREVWLRVRIRQDEADRLAARAAAAGIRLADLVRRDLGLETSGYGAE